MTRLPVLRSCKGLIFLSGNLAAMLVLQPVSLVLKHREIRVSVLVTYRSREQDSVFSNLIRWSEYSLVYP